MIVYTKTKEPIRLADEPFSSGGEGEVRSVESAPLRFTNVCVKIYYQKKRSEQQKQKIDFMVNNPPAKVSGAGFMIGWPLATVYNSSSRFIGFVMPMAFKGSKQLVNLTAVKISKNLDSAWHQKYDRTSGKASLVARLKLVNNISIPIHLLHNTGKYVLKDFKPQNVLVTHTGQVTIVDMDSVQIMEGTRLLFPGTAATDLYMPPEFYTQRVGHDQTKPIEKSWDLFALGVVYYQILFGLHPFVVTPWIMKDDSSNEISQNIAQGLFPFGSFSHKIKGYPSPHNNFKLLPSTLKSLFINALSSQPNKRPSAADWGKIIHSILSSIPEQPQPTEFLTVSEAHLSFSCNGGAQTIVVHSYPKSSIVTPVTSTWCHIKKTGDNIIVTVDENKSNGRNEYFVVRAGQKTEMVTIQQFKCTTVTPPPPPPPPPTHTVPHQIDHFNWGAFFFNGIWCICHGIWWPVLVLVGLGIVDAISQTNGFVGLSISVGIAQLIYAIMIGANANSMTWTRKKWNTITECLENEKKWNKAALWIIAICVVFFIICLIAATA